MGKASREELLAALDGLRLADVRDGLDRVGYLHYGSLDPSIRPLWRTCAFGIARTARYTPFRGPVPALDPDEYMKWSGRYYGEVCTYPWVNEIEPGDFIALDTSRVDAGLMGSENTLACLQRGARGFVCSGGVRDTDEVIRQSVPFWSLMVSKSMVQGRLQFESMNESVAIGGVTIAPGDVIVADGDGVIAVPGEVAEAVAAYAGEENARDRANRKRHYEALGRELDETVG